MDARPVAQATMAILFVFQFFSPPVPAPIHFIITLEINIHNSSLICYLLSMSLSVLQAKTEETKNLEVSEDLCLILLYL